MPVFSADSKKYQEAHRFLARILNQNCSRLSTWSDGTRDEKRVNTTVPVFVIPLVGGQPDVAEAVATVTIELSGRGLSLVMLDKIDNEQVAIGLSWEDRAAFFVANIRHQAPIGAGMWQLGLEVAQILHRGDYPNLGLLNF